MSTSDDARPPLPLRTLARAGAPGRGLAARLDLLTALGPRGALLRRRSEAELAQLERPGYGAYDAIWGEAAAETGADMSVLGDGSIELARDGRRVRVRRHVVPIDAEETLRLALDKPRVHELLAARHLPVPEHVEVAAAELSEARTFLERCGRCVVKPAAGTSGGLGVTAGVDTPAQLERALLFASRFSSRVLVERHVPGSMYRFLFLDGCLLDVVRRDPPHVTGDGRSTVAQLIFRENRRRLAAGARRELLRMDLECLFELARAGLRPGSVLPTGTTATVKCATSQGGGADSETVHEGPSEVLVDEARAAVEAVGLRLAGIDLITGDLRSRLTDAGGAIIEVNGTPGLDYHYDVADPERATRVAIPLLRRLLSEVPERGVKPDAGRAEAYEEQPSLT